MNALRTFRFNLRLCDGWRHTSGDELNYTYSRPSSYRKSRIDRIYVTDDILATSFAWKIAIAPVFTDHKIISFTMVDEEAPFHGKGRWTAPLFLLENKKVMEDIHREGLKLTDLLEAMQQRSAELNPQTLFKTFKDKITTVLRDHAKRDVPKINNTITRLEADLKRTLNDHTNYPSAEDRGLHASMIEERIYHLKELRHKSNKNLIAARERLEGETVSKYWSSLNKEKKPQDLIHCLIPPGLEDSEANRIKRSEDMAEHAKTYHDVLQQANPISDERERTRTTEAVLENVTKSVNKRGRALLKRSLTRTDVQTALDTAALGKATGLDGLPYELWKALDKRFVSDEKQQNNAPLFDIVGILTQLFNDIEDHGVCANTGFADGWICPLYKKGDKRNIANYRPITLLNTDYKLMTKAMANKLSEIANSIIHQNQAGFVPKRHLSDQTRLAHAMLSYAEANEENGVIVALDQEKAYDKISHDYLWKTLEKFNIPQKFIATIRTLYESAQSTVMINGVISSKFNVTRGVRQGDPMSCLIFIIGIEPLACMLRKSNLTGFSIPGVDDRLITSLFADDTTVYLSDEDSYDHLWETLDQWCVASRAKFNHTKTEIIPIGTPQYRDSVAITRRLTPHANPIQPGVSIVDHRQGKPTRILGSWISYGISAGCNPWTPVLEKIEKSLLQWEKSLPTLYGRKIIAEWAIGSRIQFLTKVQGMPKDVEAFLIARLRRFMWDNKHPSVNFDTLQRPLQEGGINLLDIHARVEAIELTWLTPFTDLSPNRPTWCFVEDALIAKAVTKSSTVDNLAKIHVFLQTWNPSVKNLPPATRRMLAIAKKYKVHFGALKLSNKLKKKLPIWYHIGTTEPLRRTNNLAASKCLRTNHQVHTVGEIYKLVRLREKHPDTTHQCRESKDCICRNCQDVRTTTTCKWPFKCWQTAQRIVNSLASKWNPRDTPYSDGLSLTPNRKRKNEIARRPRNADEPNDAEDREILFDPSITTPDDEGLSAVFRVFVEYDNTTLMPGIRSRINPTTITDDVTVYTDGSCIRNGDENAQAGAGAWYGPEHAKNKSIRVGMDLQSNQTGELTAILAVARVEMGLPAPLHIVTDSMYTINGLTSLATKWEAQGWIGVANRELFRAILSCLRQRGAVTTLRWVKGHSNDEGNEGADKLAGEAAEKDVEVDTDLTVDQRFVLSGAQLSTLTQRLAYRGIRERTKYTPRKTTTSNLDITRYAVNEVTNRMRSDAAIWKATRHPDLSRAFRQFAWKTLHGAHKIGTYWLKIPGYEHRADCRLCGIPEDMEHIMVGCTGTCNKTIWNLARKTWEMTGQPWPEITLGLIIGCALVELVNDEKKRLSGHERLYRILVSESAYLIWTLRCVRVIQRGGELEDWHPVNEVKSRWFAAINRRLTLDQAMTRVSLGPKALSRDIVLKTWSNVLLDNEQLPTDWIGHTGVLVGKPETRARGPWTAEPP